MIFKVTKVGIYFALLRLNFPEYGAFLQNGVMLIAGS